MRLLFSKVAILIKILVFQVVLLKKEVFFELLNVVQG